MTLDEALQSSGLYEETLTVLFRGVDYASDYPYTRYRIIRRQDYQFRLYSLGVTGTATQEAFDEWLSDHTQGRPLSDLPGNEALSLHWTVMPVSDFLPYTKHLLETRQEPVI